MRPQWPLLRDCSSLVLGLLAWSLASLATAALAHALIGVFGLVGAGGVAYEERAHGTVAPVALGAFALVALLLFRSAALRIGRSQSLDPALLLARRFGTMRPLGPALAVALGGFATLLGMEFSEQLRAVGRIEGIADALGGNAPVGLAIVAGVAAALTVLGLRSANAILRATAATVGALYAWIVAATVTLVDGAAILRRTRDLRRRRTTSSFLAQSRGLRAPPATVG